MSNTKLKARSENFLEEAYALRDDIQSYGFYSKWANEYDECMQTGLHYIAPQQLAARLSQFLHNRQAQILDVGCGTGLTALALDQLGYENFDGVDFSPDMLAVARRRSIYINLFEANLKQPLALNDSQYDAVVSTGTFTLGHLNTEPLDELARILRPGGLLACTVHREIWHKGGFAAKFETLLARQAFNELLREPAPYHAGAPEDGLYCIYQKT